MTDINNGAILVLLLPNVIFMASIMYTAEHVNILQFGFFSSSICKFFFYNIIYSDYYGLGYACV